MKIYELNKKLPKRTKKEVLEKNPEKITIKRAKKITTLDIIM